MYWNHLFTRKENKKTLHKPKGTKIYPDCKKIFSTNKSYDYNRINSVCEKDNVECPRGCGKKLDTSRKTILHFR
jgi:hypothetical protein